MSLIFKVNIFAVSYGCHLHKEKAIIGFTLSLLATLISGYSFATNSADPSSLVLSIPLWWAGIFLVISWFKKEKSDKLRIGIIFAYIGQVTLWAFSESIFAAKDSSIKIEYSVIFIAISWCISALLLFSNKIPKYRPFRSINKDAAELVREDFSDSVKEEILSRQRHRCALCNRILGVVDFHHIDGNKSNNAYSNCQALCPNCHAIKTRKRI